MILDHKLHSMETISCINSKKINSGSILSSQCSEKPGSSIYIELKVYENKYPEQISIFSFLQDLKIPMIICMGFPGGSEVKASASTVGDPGSIPGLGRSPGEGNGNPLQYSCLGNPMDRGAWQATVHGVAKSQTQLSNVFFYHYKSCQEKEKKKKR